MKIFSFLLLFLGYLLSINLVLGSAQCLADQKSLLLRLKQSLVYDSSLSTKLVQWNSSADCCQWPGVNCSNSGQVIALDLSNESISGGINSSSLFRLQYLRNLSLAYNSFNYTPIPSGFETLKNLTYLNLSNSPFAGQIPIEISHLTELVILDLSSLFFQGEHQLKLEDPNLETLVKKLKKLTQLHLDGVNISASKIEWCQALSSSLPNLQVLSMSNCDLSGPIHDSLAKLHSLSSIRLDQNSLSAQVPEFFSKFSNLTSLHLSSCELKGIFPEAILQVPTLQTLDLANNALLHGSLPEFPQNGALQTLVLSDTQFTGKLPESIGNLQMLSRIEIARCNLSGLIPKSMSDLTNLLYIDFSTNTFTGPIPSFSMSKNLTEIILSHNQLTGSVPSTYWEGFQRLVNVDMRNNSLQGRVPLSLFSLPSLQQIQLSYNLLNGQINEVINPSSFSSLNTIDLQSNKLTGPIPTFFFKFQKLSVLLLSFNSFSGQIQVDMFQNLRNLTRLELSHNNLSIGSLNRSFTTLSPRFATLKLASCYLKEFPYLANQSRLLSLDLSNNLLSGEVPSWIWSLQSLQQLNLSHNNLVGIQGSPQNSSILFLDLSSNLLNGTTPTPPRLASYVDYSNNLLISSIPDDIGQHFIFALFFSLSNNSLTGAIPESFCNAAYLQVLDLSNNNLNGLIPPCLIRKENLVVLSLRANNLVGGISGAFPSGCRLQTLDLGANRLEGKIPTSLVNCTMLEVLNLGHNQLHDTFPCWLESLPTLRVLVLRDNNFHGPIGCEYIKNNSSFEMLQIVDLSLNNFSGHLPSHCFLTWKAMMANEDEAESELNHLKFGVLELSRVYYQDVVTITIKGLEMELVKILTIFTSIDFSNNNFDGLIPDEMGELQSLYVLNLSGNAFTGYIPSSLGNLKQLESLDLSHNQLTGKIPSQLANLNFLSYLNLAFNDLVGLIPRGTQIQSFSAASFEGNKGLCGPPLTVDCPISPTMQPTSGSGERSTVSQVEFDWQFIMTGLGFGAGSALVIAPLMFCERGRKWYDERIIQLLKIFCPEIALAYASLSYDDDKVLAEEPVDKELDDLSEEDDDYEEGGTGLKTFRGRFCVFCSKLDIHRRKAIHNPRCRCHDSLPFSSSSSSSSNSSLALHIMKNVEPC